MAVLLLVTDAGYMNVTLTRIRDWPMDLPLIDGNMPRLNRDSVNSF